MRLTPFSLSWVPLLAGCAAQSGFETGLPLANADLLPQPDITIEIPSLSNCTNSADSMLRLRSDEPVTVIVHGCYSSAGQFRSLADVFAFHGQQTVCFSYDDRASLEDSSAELIEALETLTRVLDRADIQVIGHSQGGLVARRALVADRSDRLDVGVDLNLTTISAPFNGIEAASHCGIKALTWASLGLIKPICRLITGSKYKEIPPQSDFIRNPGKLITDVDQHLAISTDETGSCRRYGDDGECIEDDFVFSLHEQLQQAEAIDSRSSLITVESGHVEIVGDSTNVPLKLIDILQQEGIMHQTPVSARDELAMLLAEIYIK